MKVYIAFNGGHEARAIGVFSDEEDANRYCLQYCRESRSRVEINVEEMEVDERRVSKKTRTAKMPYHVELSDDGKKFDMCYSSPVGVLPKYHEQRAASESEIEGCFCSCFAKDQAEAVAIARAMQIEYVKSGQREKNIAEAARRREEYRVNPPKPQAYPIATNTPLPEGK